MISMHDFIKKYYIMKTNTQLAVLKAYDKLAAKSVYPITYSAIARVIKKDPSTAKYHVLALIKTKVLKRDKKTGDIYRA